MNELNKKTVSTLIMTMLMLSMALAAIPIANASTLTVPLGSAGDFAILAKTGISTTGTTLIVGDIGVSPAAATAITGFGLVLDASGQFATSSLVTGSVYAADYAVPTPAYMTTAVLDMQAAYTNAAGRPAGTGAFLNVGTPAGTLDGLTLVPGVYTWTSAVTITGDITLAGSSTDVWIFQISGTLDISSGKKVILSGGALRQNIFWAVADVVSLGTTSVFNGNILAQTKIAMNTGATLNGRALAQSEVTLIANPINVGPVGSFGFTAPLPPKIIVKSGSFTTTVTALDASGNPLTTYTGANAVFTSTDPDAVITKTWANGVATLGVTLKTYGTHTITVTDGLVSKTSGSIIVGVEYTSTNVYVKVGETLPFAAITAVTSPNPITRGGKLLIYWDAVRDWDPTTGTGLIAETYATTGQTFKVTITIPESIAGQHYLIVKDYDTAKVLTDTIVTVVPKIVLTPKAGLIGDVITVTGTGFADDTLVEIKLGATTLTISPSGLKTSDLGSFTATFAIPTGAVTGTITATATVSTTAELKVGTSITLTPSKGIAGTTVTVAGKGFTPSSTVDINFGGILLLVHDYDTDSNGAFTTTFTVPPVDTGKDYTVTATDASTAHKTDSATFTMTGVTAITLAPKSGLAGTNVIVEGEWFTKGKTVTIYFDATSVGTVTASSIIPYDFTKTIKIPTDATFGAHTIKAMDSEGVYDTATYTVSERVIVIETRSTTYMPGDTLSFDIHSTVAFKTASTIVIKIYDPDDYMFWSVDWSPVLDAATDTYVVPYSAQVSSALGFHLTLPSDAKTGLYTWNATYYVTDVVAKIVKPGSFTVEAATAGVIDEKITALEQSVSLLGVQLQAALTAAEAAQAAAQAAQAAATTAGTKTDAALTAAQAATTAATAAKTAADAAVVQATTATTAANAAKASADAAKASTDGLTTLVYGAIGASLVAALAAIVALMQISKKIA